MKYEKKMSPRRRVRQFLCTTSMFATEFSIVLFWWIENLKVAGVWQGVFEVLQVQKAKQKKRAPITSMGCKVQLPC